MTLRPALVILVCIAASPVEAVNCDCNHFPWKPEECKDVCGALVVSQASQDELMTFLHFDETLAHRVVELRQTQADKEWSSLTELKKSLGEIDYKKLANALNSLLPFEASYLVQSPEARTDFRTMVIMAEPPPVGEGI